MKHSIYYLILFSSILLFSCGSEDGDNDDIPPVDIPVSTVAIQSVRDFGNNGNASDIWLQMSVSNTSLSEFWVIINPSGSTLSGTDVQGLSNDRISVVSTTSLTEFHQLGANQVDSDGNPLALNTPYTIQVYTPSDQAISSNGRSFRLLDAPPLAGRYSGSWSDNLYPNLTVTIELNGTSDSEYSGILFATASFNSCCNPGEDDGTVSFSISGNTVTEFVYDQDIFGFVGLNDIEYEDCPGIYVGDGMITPKLEIFVNFEGEDCEGPHTDGSILFSYLD